MKASFQVSFLVATVAGVATIGLAQTAARPPYSGPVKGAQSKRWEPWSAMRTAITPVLGWKLGIDAGSFPQVDFDHALAEIDALSVGYVEASSTQKLDMEIPKYISYKLAPGEVNAIKDKLTSFNLVLVTYRVATIDPGEDARRKLFDFSKSLNIETIVSEQIPDDLDSIDKLAAEYGINVAVGGSMRAALAAVNGRSKRIGLFADTGSWVEEGLKPVAALEQAKDRLLVINLRDRSAFGKKGHNVTLGSGVAGIPDLLQEMYRQNIKPSLITVSPGSVDGFEETVRPVMAARIDQISRTTEIRGPDRLTPEDRQQIEAAIPKQAAGKPKKPRKLLVLDINIAYGGHRSIPAENFALQRMGEQTGAYEAVFSDNLDNLKYPKIKDYDAIFLNNTVGMIFVDPEVREGLTRFIREGGGLAGNHGTSHASMDWPGFSDMVGVRRGVHRANTEEAWIKIDDPNSPLTAAFDGREFLYTDEFFRFPNPPYSRGKLHILLSIDVQKTDMNQGQVFVPGSNVARPDADYAVSWIRDYGKGRVFFCILGHNPTLFKTPALAQYFLAGIQFILGDLTADATPSSKLSPASTSARNRK
jgi:type 1 glutamine amidotransferase/sugar phosphate isomerase/epimerase